jgi:hypothetical protein
VANPSAASQRSWMGIERVNPMKKSKEIGSVPGSRKRTASRKAVGCRGKRGPGRPKGLKNKITRDLRTVITEFVQHNIGDAQELYDRVKIRNPDRAFRILAELADFALPRLNRTELSVIPPAEEREPITVSNACDASEAYEAMMLGTLPATDMVVVSEPAALPAPAPAEISVPTQEAPTPVTRRAQPIPPLRSPWHRSRSNPRLRQGRIRSPPLAHRGRPHAMWRRSQHPGGTGIVFCAWMIRSMRRVGRRTSAGRRSKTRRFEGTPPSELRREWRSERLFNPITASRGPTRSGYFRLDPA